ncbi:hypothetical protein [Marinicella rhabdoformis]|uniref:hypothetical protein n=1 Tax=Marinicella rhabdoformis TaxID=2580566 RepID=UPI0012AEBBEF|nr:hypothetical protein [Marinicella rhabdoformis]
MVKSFSIMAFILMLSTVATAQQSVSKGYKPFNLIESNKSFSQNNQFFAIPNTQQGFNQNTYNFLNSQNKGYSVHFNQDTVFGDEIVMGMKFSDLLSVRLNLVDGDQPFSIFSGATGAELRNKTSDNDLTGYQFGVSSVVKIGSQWRLGFDMGKGQIDGDALGLYQDDLNTTSLGFGVRYNQFGATVNSDFYSRSSNDLLEQSTMDITVDWHFTKEGSISFGARKSINENSGDSILDQFTGTVPYIKFKHNL